MRPAIRSTHSFHPDCRSNHREGRMASDGSGRGLFLVRPDQKLMRGLDKLPSLLTC
jgi:hypothetical protein